MLGPQQVQPGAELHCDPLCRTCAVPHGRPGREEQGEDLEYPEGESHLYHRHKIFPLCALFLQPLWNPKFSVRFGAQSAQISWSCAPNFRVPSVGSFLLALHSPEGRPASSGKPWGALHTCLSSPLHLSQQDPVPPELTTLLQQSQDHLLKVLFPADPEEKPQESPSGQSRAPVLTVVSKFKVSLRQLDPQLGVYRVLLKTGGVYWGTLLSRMSN